MTSTVDDVASFYDRWTIFITAACGDNIHLGYWDDSGATLRSATAAMTDLVIAALEVTSGDRLLDVGCGIGRTALDLARSSDVTVEGISTSFRHISTANILAEAAGVAHRVHFRYADALDLPYPDCSFDAVWALESMSHIGDKPRFVRNVARVLRRGGRFVIADMALNTVSRDPVQKQAVDNFRAAFRIPSLKLVDYYYAIPRYAGLQMHRIVDIGDRVRPSYSAIAAALEIAHHQFADIVGECELRNHLQSITAFAPLSAYALAVVVRPHR